MKTYNHKEQKMKDFILAKMFYLGGGLDKNIKETSFTYSVLSDDAITAKIHHDFIFEIVSSLRKSSVNIWQKKWKKNVCMS